MRRTMAFLVCAAGACACLAGCHDANSRESNWNFSGSDYTQGQPATITGVTGSSASPYTEGKPQYEPATNTGTTGSSASPYTGNRYNY